MMKQNNDINQTKNLMSHSGTITQNLLRAYPEDKDYEVAFLRRPIIVVLEDMAPAALDARADI